jgi:HlyD family secretion protein
MKRTSSFVAFLLILTSLGVAVMYVRAGADAPRVSTEAVTRGSIVSTISASGTLEAVETVQVGTQVSGTVQTLYADFNTIVRKGQVLARLDPSLIEAEIQRAKAGLVGAEADVERLRVALDDADRKLERAQELFARELIPRSDLDAADMAKRTSDAQVNAATAQVTQARAALAQAQVNLQKTVITSPIDGIVISRAVDVGQTVAASLQAPTLFTIAADLTRMQLKASIDESDLGSIADRQAVTFRVDAYSNDVFRGAVEQVRLNPVIEQNVVTYAAIISAPNPELKLKPGMTAHVTVDVARRDNVLRVPASALRFRPSAAMLEALGAPASNTGRQPVGLRPVATSGTSPVPPANSTVWMHDGARLVSQQIRTGVSDGALTELVEGDLPEGTRLATQVTMPGATTTRSAAPSSSNPLLGQTPPRR